MAKSKAPRERQRQGFQEQRAKGPAHAHGTREWLRNRLKPEFWIVAIFLSLGLGAVLLASLLGSLGGPSRDLNLMIGAVVLVATTIVLGFLVLSGAQAEEEPGKIQPEE